MSDVTPKHRNPLGGERFGVKGVNILPYYEIIDNISDYTDNTPESQTFHESCIHHGNDNQRKVIKAVEVQGFFTEVHVVDHRRECGVKVR